MTVQVFYRIASIEVWAYCERPKGTPWSPSEGVKVTMTDRDGTVKVNAAAMTPDGTGKFVYVYNTPSDAIKGWWHGKVVGQDGSGGAEKYGRADFSFELK